MESIYGGSGMKTYWNWWKHGGNLIGNIVLLLLLENIPLF
jgi:hypothetical protein